MEIEKFIESNRTLLDQLSGHVFIANNQSIMKFLNREASGLLGYTNQEQGIDQRYANIPCKISENSDDYIKDDKCAVKNKYLNFMTYHCFSNKIWRLVMGTRKSILNENGENIGVMVSVQDVTNSGAIDLTRFLLNNDKLNDYKLEQRYFSYYLDFNKNTLNHDLSVRQQECLFYLLRGFTCKSIAKKLYISIRTAEFHLEQLKLKFNSLTKSELIEKATFMGFYNYLPSSLLQG